MTTDTSKEAVERLANTADLFAKAMKAWQHKTQKHNEDVRDTLRALSAERDALAAENAKLRGQAAQARTEAEVRKEALGEAIKAVDGLKGTPPPPGIYGLRYDRIVTLQKASAAIRALAEKEGDDRGICPDCQGSGESGPDQICQTCNGSGAEK